MEESVRSNTQDRSRVSKGHANGPQEYQENAGREIQRESQGQQGQAASATAELRVPKKRANAGGADKGAPKKGRTAKYSKWCKAANGSFTTHNTAECRRFEKDGSPKDRLVKPFDSAKKPWKKTGGRDSSQMAYLTEQLLKLEKKHKKS